MPGTSKLAILVFPMHSLDFWHSLSYNHNMKMFLEKGGHITQAAKALFQDTASSAEDHQ